LTEPLIEIRDDPDESAYVVDVDGERAGKAVYHMRGGRHLFVHTEIDDRFSGAGLGRRLVLYALDDVRAKGGVMVPICPFFLSFLEDHPGEYEDIIDRKLTDRINRSREARA
jgi:predicted GNAT family acetyltransferase